MDDEAAKALTKLLAEQVKINIRVLRLLIRTVEMTDENETTMKEIADAVAETVPEFAKLALATGGLDDDD